MVEPAETVDQFNIHESGLGLGNFYRGEVQRTYKWRDRLDRTTNWAIVLSAAVLTWVFSQPNNPHYVLLLAVVFSLFFSFIEARRYRFLDVYRTHARILEENVIEPQIYPEELFGKSKQALWRKALAEDLEWPSFNISFLEAWSRRMRRIYIYIFTFLIVSWFLKIGLQANSGGIIAAARIGAIPGSIVIIGVTGFYAIMLALSVYELRNPRDAKGAIRSKNVNEYSWREI